MRRPGPGKPPTGSVCTGSQTGPWGANAGARATARTTSGTTPPVAPRRRAISAERALWASSSQQQCKSIGGVLDVSRELTVHRSTASRGPKCVGVTSSEPNGHSKRIEPPIDCSGASNNDPFGAPLRKARCRSSSGPFASPRQATGLDSGDFRGTSSGASALDCDDIDAASDGNECAAADSHQSDYTVGDIDSRHAPNKSDPRKFLDHGADGINDSRRMSLGSNSRPRETNASFISELRKIQADLERQISASASELRLPPPAAASSGRSTMTTPGCKGELADETSNERSRHLVGGGARRRAPVAEAPEVGSVLIDSAHLENRLTGCLVPGVSSEDSLETRHLGGEGCEAPGESDSGSLFRSTAASSNRSGVSSVSSSGHRAARLDTHHVAGGRLESCGHSSVGAGESSIKSDPKLQITTAASSSVKCFGGGVFNSSTFYPSPRTGHPGRHEDSFRAESATSSASAGGRGGVTGVEDTGNAFAALQFLTSPTPCDGTFGNPVAGPSQMDCSGFSLQSALKMARETLKAIALENLALKSEVSRLSRALCLANSTAGRHEWLAAARASQLARIDEELRWILDQHSTTSPLVPFPSWAQEALQRVIHVLDEAQLHRSASGLQSSLNTCKQWCPAMESLSQESNIRNLGVTYSTQPDEQPVADGLLPLLEARATKASSEGRLRAEGDILNDFVSTQGEFQGSKSSSVAISNQAPSPSRLDPPQLEQSDEEVGPACCRDPKQQPACEKSSLGRSVHCTQRRQPLQRSGQSSGADQGPRRSMGPGSVAAIKCGITAPRKAEASQSLQEYGLRRQPTSTLAAAPAVPPLGSLSVAGRGRRASSPPHPATTYLRSEDATNPMSQDIIAELNRSYSQQASSAGSGDASPEEPLLPSATQPALGGDGKGRNQQLASPLTRITAAQLWRLQTSDTSKPCDRSTRSFRGATKRSTSLSGQPRRFCCSAPRGRSTAPQPQAPNGHSSSGEPPSPPPAANLDLQPVRRQSRGANFPNSAAVPHAKADPPPLQSSNSIRQPATVSVVPLARPGEFGGALDRRREQPAAPQQLESPVRGDEGNLKGMVHTYLPIEPQGARRDFGSKQRTSCSMAAAYDSDRIEKRKNTVSVERPPRCRANGVNCGGSRSHSNSRGNSLPAEQQLAAPAANSELADGAGHIVRAPVADPSRVLGCRTDAGGPTWQQQQRKPVFVPKLQLQNHNVGVGSWLSGELTRGDTYMPHQMAGGSS